MSRKRRSGATGGPSGSCHRAGIHKKGSLVLDAFAPSSPNLPALIQLAGIIVQPVTQTLFRQLWVAAAGPSLNLGLAPPAALTFHLVGYLPVAANQWIAQNLKNALIVNVLLAVFNMMPLPPLDGGRVAVGLLPDLLAAPLARLEPYGILILIGLLFIVPMLGPEMGVDLTVMSRVVG